MFVVAFRHSNSPSFAVEARDLAIPQTPKMRALLIDVSSRIVLTFDALLQGIRRLLERQFEARKANCSSDLQKPKSDLQKRKVRKFPLNFHFAQLSTFALLAASFLTALVVALLVLAANWVFWKPHLRCVFCDTKFLRKNDHSSTLVRILIAASVLIRC